MDSSIGRPSISIEQKESFFRKLEPYLKIGLSVNKACLQAKIPKSTIYDLIHSDEKFAEKIATCKQYVSVLVSDTLVSDLTRISDYMKSGKKLGDEDFKRVAWFALNSGLTKEEFGNRVSVEYFDPEVEIRRIMKLIDDKVDEVALNTKV